MIFSSAVAGTGVQAPAASTTVGRTETLTTEREGKSEDEGKPGDRLHCNSASWEWRTRRFCFLPSGEFFYGDCMNSKQMIEQYLYSTDWKVRENSNSPYSFGALNKHVVAEVSKDYWLNEVYDEPIRRAYETGDMHIHDLGGLTLYCCGYSLRSVIERGVQGVPNIPKSKPAKHFASILNQLSNLITVFQNEIMGAVAFSSVDTYLAPFIRHDQLNYEQVKQSLQNFIFSVNSNSRGGAEPAFSNITLDLCPPSDMKDKLAIIGAEEQDYTYGDCQKEMDLFNRAFCELMIEGDADGRPFAYPIPTYNIHEEFDFDDPKHELLWEMTGKFGYPYFANFIHSDMRPEDARSMCCRLRLDLRELQRRNGGLFGAGESTGSIGVVTINLPRLAYQSRSKEAFFEKLQDVMDLAKDSLEKKRVFLEENIVGTGLIPAFDTYVGTLANHFHTIGLVGLNEMCVNLLGTGILSPEGKEFSERVLDFMREKLSDYQEETENLYNLEATPAESTAFRLARKDIMEYPDIFVQGTREAPYYTNSCHIPVHQIESIRQVFDHQESLQTKFTGGTVVHVYLKSPIHALQAKHMVRSVCENYSIPYLSLSPVNHYCEDHGYIEESCEVCPTCSKPVEKYQRITGYLRNVKHFNDGKRSEFMDRVQL